MHLKLLLSPLAAGAYFAETLDVARAELSLLWPEVSIDVERRAGLTLLDVTAPADALGGPDGGLSLEARRLLARRSWLQAAFTPVGEALRPIEVNPDFELPEALVWGAKYRGKTNELVTQLALNVALAVSDVGPGVKPKVLDPMAGRGTTLLWAARYGLDARGIELDRRALDDLQRHVKRQCKLHRIKHTTSRGFVGARNKQGVGRFVQYGLGSTTVKLVAGDSRDAPRLLAGERFTMVVTDLPYGVQHTGPGGTRNPVEVLAACADGWFASLRPGGALVMVFNALQPRRAALIEPFTAAGFVPHPFSAAHRMSESILRDFAVFTRARAA